MTPAKTIHYTYLNRPAAQALYHALTPDPFYRTLEEKSFADPADAQEAMFRYMDYSMAEARAHGRLTFLKDKSMGAAIWSLPLPRETSDEISKQKKRFLAGHLGPESLDAYCRIVDFMSGQIVDVIPETAWYLSILGILPDHQGRGLGRELMMPVLNDADKENRVVFAESFTPQNFGFYQKLGFETAKTVDEPVTGSAYTILVRQPRG